MSATNSTVKPRQLWNSPKVTISPDLLIVEGRYYPLNQTRGAVVEVVPAPPKPETSPEAAPAVKKPLTFGAILKGIGFAFIIIFALLLSWFWNDNDIVSGGAKQDYQLLMLTDQDRIVALKHTNQKKLAKIAEAVNQALQAQGKTPDTGSLKSN